MDEQEVIRWFHEGLTYDEMSRRYRAQYDIEMSPSAWGNFRRRRGLVRRIVRDDNLIPWAVEEEHRYRFPLRMLRVEARVRAGEPITETDAAKHESWLRFLRDENLVVAYLPETPEGFHYVTREPGDTDVIRRPTVGLTTRRRAD
ncbi:hypothetical protein [Blastococcus sp. SYSU DS0973]